MSASDDILKECREILARGGGVDAVIGLLRTRGHSKVQSIKALVDLGQMDMAAAKVAVHNSATWDDVRERDEEFHRRLL